MIDPEHLIDLFPTTSPALARAATLRQPRSEQIALRAAQARQQADAADAEPLDVAALQAYGRARSEAAQQRLVMALAAQQAGKEFQPVAQHFLAEARSASRPVEIAGGVLDGEQFVADPAASRQKRIDAIRRHADTLDRLALTAASSEDRADAARQAQELRERLASQQIEFRREIEAGRRADRAQAGSLRADIAAAARAESAEQKRQGALEKDVQALSKRGEDIAPLVQAARDVDEMLTRYGDRSIPGVGYTAMLPGVALSKEGTVNRARVQAVANALLKAQSGAAVTLSESERFAAEMLANGKYSEAEFRAAWPQLLARINAGIGNLEAGFRPEVLDTYRGRGGNISRIGAPPKQEAGDLSPQERAELETLRGRFGGRR